jgi:hypothetical protein
MKKLVRLADVSDGAKKREAKEVRELLFARCRAAIDQMGDDIAGFALVVWDQRGDMRTAYDAERGPISFALVPTLVSDALNRHVAVKIAEQQIAEQA